MSVRILDTTLLGDYVNGQVIYGADLNKIIDVLKGGVNYNKSDLDKMFQGIETAFVFETKTAADTYLEEEVAPANGQVAFVMSDGTEDTEIFIYKYSTSISAWVYYSTFSLYDIYNRGVEIETELATTHYLPTVDTTSTTIALTLADNEDKTYTYAGIETVGITFPNTITQGFHAGINYISGATPTAVVFTNESAFTLKLFKYNIPITNYVPTAARTVVILSYCDGINLYCYINEVE